MRFLEWGLGPIRRRGRVECDLGADALKRATVTSYGALIKAGLLTGRCFIPLVRS